MLSRPALIACVVLACQGERGAPGRSCSVATGGDGSSTIGCEDGTRAVIRSGRDGTSCQAERGTQGELRILCDDGTQITIPVERAGGIGDGGLHGTNGSVCSVSIVTGGESQIRCGDGTSVTLKNGEPGPPGKAGSSCTVMAGVHGESTIACEDGTAVVIRAGQVGDQPPTSLAPNPRRRHVILIIGDGMQLACEISGSRYLHGTDHDLTFHRFPVRSFVTTWDVTTYNKYAASKALPAYSPYAFEPSVGYDPAQGGVAPYPLVPTPNDAYFLTALGGKEPATDSASAATAMATGLKTDDGNVAWLSGDPADGSLVTIAERLRAERGVAVGVVSSAPFSHATPATFAGHNVDRNNYAAIAAEIAEVTKPDVVIGGGHPAWNGDHRFVDATTIERLRSSTEYLLVERQAQVDGSTALLAAAVDAVAQKKKLFGLFGGPGGNFDYAVPAHSPGSPLVIRGSIENPSLADAAEAALRVLEADPDGLFLMIEQGDIDWANHANNFRDMIGSVVELELAVRRVVEFVERPHDAIDWGNTLVLVTADHANGFLRFGPTALGAGDLPAQECTAGCQYPHGEINYRTGNHTNELVTLYARGAGAEFVHSFERIYAGRGIIDNVDIFHLMMTMAMR